MVKFDDNQFEIAIVTYKRHEYIESWLERCYQSALERNIRISIYDSSPNDETLKVVEKFNIDKDVKVAYHRVDERTLIGYKPMIPILNTTAEFLWVSGDSRFHNFRELDDKIFVHIKDRKIDYVVINTDNNYQLPDIVYCDKSDMIHDTFVPSTCIGLSIYRVSIFNVLKSNPELMHTCDQLFKKNYGFGWLGYFYQVYACGEYKTLLVNVETLSVLKKKKKQAWAVRFYGCWVDDLCQIIENIPNVYAGKNDIPRNTWKVMKLENFCYGYLARKYGDLNADKYEKMVSSRIIDRITGNPCRIKFYATAPMWMIDCVYYCYKVMSMPIRLIKKIIFQKE